MTDADIKAAMLAGDFERLANNQAVEDAYSPFDAVAGGLAGLMTTPVKSFARFAGETAIDPAVEAAINYAANENPDMLKAMYIGKRGMRNLGIDAGQDLAGQFSALHDRMPRLEIDDSGSRRLGTTEEDKVLGDILEHEALYGAYDGLRGSQLEQSVDVKYPNSSGFYDSDTGTIGIDKYVQSPRGWPQSEPDIELHEIQHKIQRDEGHSVGGSPKLFDSGGKYHKDVDVVRQSRNGIVSSDELYRRLAGEIEARDTAARMQLSPAERARTQPYSGYAAQNGELVPTYEPNPIPLDDFIVRHEAGQSMSLPMDEASRMQYNGGMSDDIIDRIKKRASELAEDYEYIGLRTADGPPTGDYATSYVWDDGEITSEALDGLSVTDISEKSWPYSHIKRDSIKSPSGFYYGDNVYLVGSNDLRGYGADAGELLVEPEFFEEVFRHKK